MIPSTQISTIIKPIFVTWNNTDQIMNPQWKKLPTERTSKYLRQFSASSVLSYKHSQLLAFSASSVLSFKRTELQAFSYLDVRTTSNFFHYGIRVRDNQWLLAKSWASVLSFWFDLETYFCIVLTCSLALDQTKTICSDGRGCARWHKKIDTFKQPVEK